MAILDAKKELKMVGIDQIDLFFVLFSFPQLH